jgi:hypothetical protein
MRHTVTRIEECVLRRPLNVWYVYLKPRLTIYCQICTIIANYAHFWKDMSALDIRHTICEDRQKSLKVGYKCLILSLMTKRDHLLLSKTQNSQFCSSVSICVRFLIVWHIKTNIVKHVLIWPVMDFYYQQWSRTIQNDEEHQVWLILLRYHQFWQILLKNARYGHVEHTVCPSMHECILRRPLNIPTKYI